MDAEKLANWVGGATDIGAAISLLSQGGVPAAAVVSGGRITEVRMEHAWVRAYVNWVPARGAKNYSAKTHLNANPALNAWVDIDTSYKRYTLSTPIDLQAAVPLDPAAVRSAATIGAVVDTTQGFVSGMLESTALEPLRAYGDAVQSYLDGLPELTLSDLVRSKQIVPVTSPLLAGCLPYAPSAAVASATLPESLRHAVTVKLFNSRVERALDSPALSYRISLPALSSRRLGVSYEPATAADAQVIAAAQSSGATSLPAYLVNLRAVLLIDGNTVASGPSPPWAHPRSGR